MSDDHLKNNLQKQRCVNNSGARLNLIFIIDSEEIKTRSLTHRESPTC